MNLPLRLRQILLLGVATAVLSAAAAGQTPSSPADRGNAVCRDCPARPADATVRTGRRVALVIGNGGYKEAGTSLANPPNDANDIAAALTAIGFEVVTVIDATKRDMDTALENFARTATSADAALFFYAGHALQFQGRNYLMPIDGKLQDEISVTFAMVGVDAVQLALNQAKGVKILILDACRNNPLAGRLARASRGGALLRGLAPVNKTAGMVVAYATAADDVADDGEGRNSPYTTALLKQLQQPGLEIEMMFRRVASDVNAQTNGRQRPITEVSLLSEYYLNQQDRIAWDGINKDDAVALREFVNRYPSSRFVSTAVGRLAALQTDELMRRQQDLLDQEARLRAEQLAAQKQTDEERLKREEEARQKQADQERLKRDEEARQRRADQERQKRDEEEEARQKQAEGARKREEEAARRREDNERPLPPVAMTKPLPMTRPELPEAKPGDFLRDCSDCPELVVVPAGEFLMGSAGERDNGVGNEGPQHKVLIRQPLAVGRFEVTRDQFEAFVRASGYKAGDRCYTLENNKPQERIGRSFLNPGFPQAGAHPAVCVNWADAKAYVAWLTQVAGKSYRLLSEAEWEYVARAGSTLRYGFANDTTAVCKFANGADQVAKFARLPANNTYANCSDGHAYTAPVGSYEANAFGLFDLLGNAWEWTEDCFYNDYAGAPSDGSARPAADDSTADSCSYRTVRGGGWFSAAESLRPTVRAGAAAVSRYDEIGFRVARPLNLVSTARP